MTKEELLEDVKIGDVVKIYTESDEVVEGEVIDFGESGLKITLLNSNRSKRIMYGRILEYETGDLCDDAPAAVSRADTKETVNPGRKDVPQKTIALDRRDIFGEAGANIDPEAVKESWAKKLDPEQRNEYVRISNMLEYARKVHEFSIDSDRVKRAIMEYKKLANTDKIMNLFLALIYHECNDVRTALGYYHEAGAYDVEFQLSLKYGYEDDLFEKAILAVAYNGENEAVVKWLCEYAVKNNDFAVISHMVSHCDQLLGKVLLYWYIDKPQIQMMPEKEDIFSEANTVYLKNISAADRAQNDTHIQAILSGAKGASPDRNVAAADPSDIVYKGRISYYNKNGGNGMIRNVDGGSIYFYIKQVKDLELQRILATEQDFKRPVTYTKGINFREEIAADAIALDGADTEESAETGREQEGFFDDYDCEEEWGKICSGDETFNFSFNSIKDPLLYAEIMSRPYTVSESAIKFNVKDHKSKKTKKVSKVAFNICSLREYTQEEIDDFISQRYITREDVNEWLGTAAKEEEAGSFRVAVYEPLRSIDTAARDEIVPEKIAVRSDEIAKKAEEARSGERKAVSILLGSNDANPFKDLKRDVSGKKYFEEAHYYKVGRKTPSGEIVGVDLEKAEELFIRSIRAMDQTNSAVANLVNIYIKQGGDSIVKGLQLLEEYGYLFSSEKLTNLRIQLIDKSGNFEALEQILLSAIPNCVKNNTIWQYMTKLARLYYKQQRWADAIAWFDKSLSCLEKNRALFPQYQRLHYYNLKSLIIAKYAAGNREEAIAQAKELIEIAPDDAVIKAILEGTFEPNKDMEDMEELKYEDDLFDVTNSEMSLYLQDELQSFDLSIIFGKVAIVYEKLQGGRYTGNADDLNRAVKFINENLLGRNKRGINAETRSKINMGIARIISDSRENSSSSNGDKVVALDEVNHYVARYARYSADVLVAKPATAAVDSIRFLYIQALRYLEDKDNGNISVAMNMLMASFFIEQTKLPDELRAMGNSGYNDKYYEKNCLSVKDLLIASFMLKERQKYVTIILTKIYNEPPLRQRVVDCLNKMSGSEKEITQYYDFDRLWKQAERTYSGNLEQLGKEISDSINEYHMPESVRNHIQRIREILEGGLLWNQDEQVIGNYLDLISLSGDTIEKYTVQEKIEGFRMVETKIENLKKDIEEAPTEFSYDYVYLKLEELRFSIRERLNELYQSSRPECRIFLSSNSVYVNEKKAEIAITFQNADYKQHADAVEITLEGSEGASFDHFEKKFTSVRSGESQDYLAVFSLDEKVISEGQFEVTVSMQYEYSDSVESRGTATIREILPVNITDKAQYVSIVNYYKGILRGAGVDVNTPDLFKGRNELIDSICASMSSSDGIMIKNRGIILWGQRRVGKNSVKDYLKKKIRSEYPEAYILIELGSIGGRKLSSVLGTMAHRTEDVLANDYPELYFGLLEMDADFFKKKTDRSDSDKIDGSDDEMNMDEFSSFMYRFTEGLKKISPEGKNIPLFFIDEFSHIYEWIEEGMIDGTEFMRFWKSFISEYGICAIIIAQDNLPVWKAKYQNEFACMDTSNEITYLDKKGAKELICEPCSNKGERELFTQEAVDLIYDLTKGSAYLIVIFCYYIIKYLNDNYTEKATKTIVKLVFEKWFIDDKEMFEACDFEPQINDCANVVDGGLIKALNEELLKEIARLTKESPQVRMDKLKFFADHGDQAKKVFTRLKERKIIEVERETYCSISMPLLTLYLLRELGELDRDTFNKMIR